MNLADSSWVKSWPFFCRLWIRSVSINLNFTEEEKRHWSNLFYSAVKSTYEKYVESYLEPKDLRIILASVLGLDKQFSSLAKRTGVCRAMDVNEVVLKNYVHDLPGMSLLSPCDRMSLIESNFPAGLGLILSLYDQISAEYFEGFAEHCRDNSEDACGRRQAMLSALEHWKEERNRTHEKCPLMSEWLPESAGLRREQCQDVIQTVANMSPLIKEDPVVCTLLMAASVFRTDTCKDFDCNGRRLSRWPPPVENRRAAANTQAHYIWLLQRYLRSGNSSFSRLSALIQAVEDAHRIGEVFVTHLKTISPSQV